MKLNQILYILAIFCFSFTVTSQSKVGTVNVNLIVSNLPDIAQVKSGIQNYEKQLQEDLKLKLKAYENEVENGNNAFETMSTEAKRKKQEDIYKLETDIQKFRQNAAQLVQLKQDELMRPLYKKVGDAISLIAKEEKYTQVLTLDGNELAYVDMSYDLTIKVANKLGVTIK